MSKTTFLGYQYSCVCSAEQWFSEYIKRLSIQQVQQGGPVTLGALPLSISHPALLGVRVKD